MIRALLCAALIGLALIPARPAAQARQPDPGPADCPKPHCVYLPDVERRLPLVVGTPYVVVGGGKFPVASAFATLQNLSGAAACDVTLTFVVGETMPLSFSAVVGRIERDASVDVELLSEVDPAVLVSDVQVVDYRPCA